jgi:hypothetical protein
MAWEDVIDAGAEFQVQHGRDGEREGDLEGVSARLA